jgi:hypothetical protein
MSFKQLVLISIFWAQTCLALGVLSGVLSVKDFITTQVSLIMLISPSPILQDRENKEDND